ncbi:MAG TPA: acetylxylan esterase, partial [Clostridiales bacterium]|nr:acetylxylan esterase [Clostridiales bacterium]
MSFKNESCFLELNLCDINSQLKSYIYKLSDEAFLLGDNARDSINSIGEFEKRRTYLREKFIESMGGLSSLETPLNPVVTGTIEGDGFRIEKVILESRPKTYVTCNLYIPNNIDKPVGAVLLLCGHSQNGKEDYQIACQYFAKAGMVVLVQDPIGQSERLSYYDAATGKINITWGTYEHNYAGSQSLFLGEGIARYFLHDSVRAIDYLCTRPEVDPTKIGVTGCSGGGTQTCMLMLYDQRIAAAAP